MWPGRLYLALRMAMEKSLFILGRQPSLGLAELESLYGAQKLEPIGDEAAILAVEPSTVDFARLGGSIKLSKVFFEINSTKWPDIQKALEQELPDRLADLPDGKIRLGISAYGLKIGPKQLIAAGLTVKNIIRGRGRSVRLVPNQTPALNSAQVLHNRLIGDVGCEIVCVRNGAKTIVSRTVAEQDIESYTWRDRGRPKRDSRVGMLPPKLAQIIVNLAGKHVPPVGAIIDPNNPVNKNPQQARLLDPFCGTGVILQEALLLGYNAYGTDLEPRMVEYSGANLDWLGNKFHFSGTYQLASGDATTFHWQQPVDLIASEIYLGQPFNTVPSPEKLAQVHGTCNVILEKFLQNVGGQVRSGTRLCLAVPAWQTASGKFKYLPLIDRVSDLGYNRVRFEHVRNDELLYYREDQIVARELLVLTKR